jgi:hypothetical protein
MSTDLLKRISIASVALALQLFGASAFAQSGASCPLGQGAIRVDVKPTSAAIELKVDDTRVPNGQDICLPVGRHRLETAAYGFQTDKRSIVVTAAATRSVIDIHLKGPSWWGRRLYGGVGVGANVFTHSPSVPPFSDQASSTDIRVAYKTDPELSGVEWSAGIRVGGAFGLGVSRSVRSMSRTAMIVEPPSGGAGALVPTGAEFRDEAWHFEARVQPGGERHEVSIFGGPSIVEVRHAVAIDDPSVPTLRWSDVNSRSRLAVHAGIDLSWFPMSQLGFGVGARYVHALFGRPDVGGSMSDVQVTVGLRLRSGGPQE